MYADSKFARIYGGSIDSGSYVLDENSTVVYEDDEQQQQQQNKFQEYEEENEADDSDDDILIPQIHKKGVRFHDELLADRRQGKVRKGGGRGGKKMTKPASIKSSDTRYDTVLAGGGRVPPSLIMIAKQQEMLLRKNREFSGGDETAGSDILKTKLPGGPVRMKKKKK